MNLKKTDIMYQPPLGSHEIGQDIQIKGLVQTQVNKFRYLSFTVVNNDRLKLTGIEQVGLYSLSILLGWN